MAETQALCTSRSLVTAVGVPQRGVQEGRQQILGAESLKCFMGMRCSTWKDFLRLNLKSYVSSPKVQRLTCWQGGGVLAGQSWVLSQDTPTTAAPCALLRPAPASSRESSGRDSGVPGWSLKPPLAWEYHAQEDAGADLRHSTARKTTCYKRGFYRKEKNVHWKAEECLSSCF